MERIGALRIVRRNERGVVLFVALLVMVALSLAGIALIRSVDTATIVTGNLAFKQAAASAVDRGVERAIEALFDPRPGSSPFLSNTQVDNPGRNYFASVRRVGGNIPEIPAELASKTAAQALTNKIPEDAAGNTTSYVIERMCAAPGAATAANCNMAARGRANEAGTVGEEYPGRPGTAFYRVTVRVDGPRNTVAFGQAMVR